MLNFAWESMNACNLLNLSKVFKVCVTDRASLKEPLHFPLPTASVKQLFTITMHWQQSNDCMMISYNIVV